MEKMPDEIYAWMGFQDNGSWDREPCVCDSHESVKYIRADLADLSPETVPAGWKLVPISLPNQVYTDAVAKTRSFLEMGLTFGDDPIESIVHIVHKATLAAAPEPPELEASDENVRAPQEPQTEKLPHIEGLSEAIDHCETIEKELREYHQFPKSFVMQIPARPNADSDFMFSRLFKAAREYLKRMDSKE